MRSQISSDEAHRIAFGFSPPDDWYFATRLRDGLGERGRTPRRSRTERQQRAGQAAEEIGFGTCRGERKANAARGLDDPGGDFQKPKTQRRELGSGQFPDFGNGVAHGQHQPISGRMEHETDLVGERRTATGAIGGELRLVQLDQILSLAACAIQAVVDPLGRADIEAGDDEADVEAELRRLDTGDGAPFAIPGLCLVARLGIVPIHPLLIELGLLERLLYLMNAGEERLLPEWKEFARGDGTTRWSQPITKSWQYVKKVLKIVRADLTLYATRHLMADWLDNSTVAKRTRDRILGHVTHVPGGYGRKGSITADQMAAITALEPEIVKQMREILMAAKDRANEGVLTILKPLSKKRASAAQKPACGRFPIRR